MSKVLREAFKRPDAKRHQQIAAAERAARPGVKETKSKCMKAVWSDPDYRQNVRESIKHAKNLPESKQKTSASMKIIANRPEQRDRVSKQSKERWSNPEFKKQRIVAMSGQNSPNWRGGLSFEPYCPKFNNEFKERVRVFFDRRCLLCGKEEIDNGKRLSVHHCDYDKEVCCNDRPPIFAAVCCRHNTLANHDRERWRLIFHRIIEEVYGGKCYYTKEEFYNLPEPH